ncbi:MAG: YraN family protein [Pseudomonadota bacterium]
MPRVESRQRKAAERRGRRSERIAELWLMLKGYQILARRVRLPMGEIDLIARRSQVLAFVEVKQRKSLALAQDAVSELAWRRISAAAATWAARRNDLVTLTWRYDLVAIVEGQRPHHFRDYWRP